MCFPSVDQGLVFIFTLLMVISGDRYFMITKTYKMKVNGRAIDGFKFKTNTIKVSKETIKEQKT